MNNVIVAIIFILLVSWAMSPTIAGLDEEHKTVEKTEQHDEVVNQITYNHGFLEGNYCMIVTDKGFYSMNGKNCVINKVGNKLLVVYEVYGYSDDK